jgi:Transcriptional regulators
LEAAYLINTTIRRSNNLLDQAAISKIRNFNRDYTKLLGIMNKKVLNTPLSWTEGRVLLEISFNNDKTPIEVANNLELDKSYTSRILKRFEKNGLIRKSPSSTDSRSVDLSLTTAGQELVNELDDRSNQQIQDLLTDLSTAEQKQFYQAMTTLDNLLFTRK